jgi:hypothetical protein
MIEAGREVLPDRRRCFTADVTFEDEVYSIGIGFVARGGLRGGAPVMEVFATGPKAGSAMQAIVSDACIIISIALQCGIQPAELAKSLGRIPRWTDGREHEGPASVIGLIVEALQAEDIE